MIIQPDTQAPFRAINLQSVKDGVPRRRYHKDIIITGEFVKDADDIRFEVTPQSLEHWALTFAEMKGNGVRVPIPSTHANAGNPDFNRGYVEDMFVDGNRLVMTCELIGKDAIKTAARSDVSIFSPSSFKDGKGNVYEQPIMHVALCTDPVIPGLGEFIPLAASLANKELDMKWNSIQKALGIEDEMTDENAGKLIGAAFKALKEEVKAAGKKITASQSELDVIRKASEEKPKPPDTVLVNLVRDNRELKLSGLVSGARITPDVKDKLTELFVGEDCKAIVLQLTTGTQGIFDELIKVLAANNPVKLKESTGPQLMELSDGNKENKSNPLVADAQRRAKAAVA